MRQSRSPSPDVRAESSSSLVYVPALDLQLPLLLDVAEAGGLGLMSRSRAYAAAREGVIPTIRVGHRLRVPTARWLDVLGLAYTPSETAGAMA